MSDGALAPWRDASEEERRSILAALQAIADAEVRALRWYDTVPLSRKPAVEVFAARRAAGILRVHFLYDFRLSRQAQSGSDWDEHHFHNGEAVFRDGAVVSHTIVKDMDTISESDCASYDAEGAFRKRRAMVDRAYWEAWMSLPFPFPGEPGP